MAVDESLVIHVPSRPMLVAGRLRVHMEQRGYPLVPDGGPAPPTGFTLVIRRDGPGACWIHPDVTDAVPAELGQRLSQDLRCRVTSFGQAGNVAAYEVADNGTLVEKLAVKGQEVLESQGSPFETKVQAGQALSDLLEEAGLTGLGVSFDEARTSRRAIVMGFAPRQGRSDEQIEIDPLLECPICGAAMRSVQGPHGPFFGCVRYPECKGRYTAKQAAANRKVG